MAAARIAPLAKERAREKHDGERIMSSAFLSLINSVDLAIAEFLPLAVRVALWGLFSGGVGMAVYALASSQASISRLKAETKQYRKQMIAVSMESYSEYSALAKQNLKTSLALLGKVLVPAVLSALPVLIIAGWMDAYHGYILPAAPGTVALTFVPDVSRAVQISPPEVARIERGALVIAPSDVHRATITVSADGKAIYSGDLFGAPASVVAKKGWINLIMPSVVGYLNSASPVDEIHLALPRKRLLNKVPSWAAGWEVPYFLNVFIAALVLKRLFNIQ
jgi:hypothetical protein